MFIELDTAKIMFEIKQLNSVSGLLVAESKLINVFSYRKSQILT
jgi:hypothetical protein